MLLRRLIIYLVLRPLIGRDKWMKSREKHAYRMFGLLGRYYNIYKIHNVTK